GNVRVRRNARRRCHRGRAASLTADSLGITANAVGGSRTAEFLEETGVPRRERPSSLKELDI
ncbi:hypothetical protein, partial [Treponema endosymbiont of Eucomonympha sp.]|uniref:hypothetical protein n=1 Tax=Treponema endosymbiont of Eucomonympha sp. TaxID=1580831 RepID=UPI001E4D7EC2